MSFICHAQSLGEPAGSVILTITGAIGVTNVAESAADGETEHVPSARFDLPMLEASGLATIVTETPWTDGRVEFEGVLARDILELVDAKGKSLHMVAIDEYVVDVPVQDLYDHDVIIATRISGKPMRIRDNGPLWLIYPWSDYPSLRDPLYYARSIWQLKKIVVKQ